MSSFLRAVSSDDCHSLHTLRANILSQWLTWNCYVQVAWLMLKGQSWLNLTWTHFSIPSKAYFGKYIPPSKCSSPAALILLFSFFCPPNPRSHPHLPPLHITKVPSLAHPPVNTSWNSRLIRCIERPWASALNADDDVQKNAVFIFNSAFFFPPGRICWQKSGKVTVGACHSLEEEGRREMRQIHLSDERPHPPHAPPPPPALSSYTRLISRQR